MRLRCTALALGLLAALPAGPAVAQPITFQFAVGGNPVTSLTFLAANGVLNVDVFMTQAAGNQLSNVGLVSAGASILTPGGVARVTAVAASDPALNLLLSSNVTPAQA